MKRKAEIIHQKNTPRDNGDIQRITLPTSPPAQHIARSLRQGRLNVAFASGIKIGELVRRKALPKGSDTGLVYSISCGQCDKAYVGETSRSLKVRLREHQADMAHHRTSNALVLHMDATGHLPKWNDTSTIHRTKTRLERKALEAAEIATKSTVNTKPGSFTWAPTAAYLTLKTV